MSDEITAEGKKRKKDALLAAKDDIAYVKEANARQITTNHLAITHVLALIFPTVYLRDSEVLENISNWQKAWKDKTSGASGEVLIKIAGLLNLDPAELLNPTENFDLKAILKEKTMIVVQNRQLAEFIEKTFEEIKDHDKSKAEDIRWAIGLKDNTIKMNFDNIQKSLNERLEKRKDINETKSLLR